MTTFLIPLLLIVIGSLLCKPCFGEAEPLKVGIHYAGEPLVYYDDKKIIRGIIPELLNAISEASNIAMQFTIMPYQRIFTAGTQQTQDLGLVYRINDMPVGASSVELECFDRPFIRSQLKIFSTGPATRDEPILATYTSIANERLRYPEINGKKVRVIGLTNAQAMFKSLVTGRVDYIVGTQLQGDYWQNKINISNLQSAANIGQATGYLCYPSDKRQLHALKSLSAFMDNVRHQGLLADIYGTLQRYQLPLAYGESVLFDPSSLTQVSEEN